MSQEKEIAIGFMVAFSENPDKILDSICSPAVVDNLIAERIECTKSQKAENLTKDPHVNVNNTSLQNYVGTGLIQDPVDTVFEFVEGKVDCYYTETPVTFDSKEEEDTDFHRTDVCDMVELQDSLCRIVEVDMQDFPTMTIDELDLWEPEQIPDTPTRLPEGQILEESMFKEIEFQGIDKCKRVEL